MALLCVSREAKSRSYGDLLKELGRELSDFLWFISEVSPASMVSIERRCRQSRGNWTSEGIRNSVNELLKRGLVESCSDSGSGGRRGSGSRTDDDNEDRWGEDDSEEEG